VLARFLDAPAIFRTRLAATYDARARDNLTAAVAELRAAA
jgi:predicted metal-dependent HD superfamily phosphohydrolase